VPTETSVSDRTSEGLYLAGRVSVKTRRRVAHHCPSLRTDQNGSAGDVETGTRHMQLAYGVWCRENRCRLNGVPGREAESEKRGKAWLTGGFDERNVLANDA